MILVLISSTVFASTKNNCAIYFEELNRLKYESTLPRITSFADEYVDKIELLEKMLILKGYYFVEGIIDANYELTFKTGEAKISKDSLRRYSIIQLKQIDNGQIFRFYEESETKLFHGPMKEYPLLFSAAFKINWCKK